MIGFLEVRAELFGGWSEWLGFGVFAQRLAPLQWPPQSRRAEEESARQAGVPRGDEQDQGQAQHHQVDELLSQADLS